MEPHRDSKHYYKVLRVRPSARSQEIQLSFERLEELSEDERGIPWSKILQAYSVLSDPRARKVYDQMETASEQPEPKPPARRRFDDVRLLIAIVVLLAGILGFVWYPLYGSRFRSFSTGDRLVDLRGAPFGLIVRSDDTHTFPGGAQVPAFLVEVESTGDLVWYPAADIKSACRRSP